MFIEIIEEVTKDLKIPIIYNFPVEHIQDNCTLIMGKQIIMDVTAEESKVVFE